MRFAGRRVRVGDRFKLMLLSLLVWSSWQVHAEAQAACLSAPITFARARGKPSEFLSLSLTHCDGRPNLRVLDALSVLARPAGLDAPTRHQLQVFWQRDRRRHTHLSPQIRRLHPGLLIRLQLVANRFPHRLIQVVSGHRPGANRGSRHKVGRALDIRVGGVHRKWVAEFARTIRATGVGYYPNSSFTHIDVREQGTFWVDRSGPGQKADYTFVVATEKRTNRKRRTKR